MMSQTGPVTTQMTPSASAILSPEVNPEEYDSLFQKAVTVMGETVIKSLRGGGEEVHKHLFDTPAQPDSPLQLEPVNQSDVQVRSSIFPKDC